MKHYRNFALAGALLVLFAVLTVMLMYVDISPIGPEGSSVGLSAINAAMADLLGVHLLLYIVTDWLSVAAILIALGFAVLGLVQLIRRKSLKRVDPSILVLGGFYLLVIGAYTFFEYHVVNYRPVLIQNVLEASYPSSTTMLVLCIIPTAIMQFNRLIQASRLRTAVNTASIIFAAVIVVGRLVSGVHWLTDILGSVLLSSALVMLYYSVVQYIALKQRQ